MGDTFCHYIEQETHRSALEIVRAYAASLDILGIEPLWQQLDQLGLDVADDAQRECYIALQELLERTTLWLLEQHQEGLPIETLVARYRPAIETLAARLPELLDSSAHQHYQQRCQQLEALGLQLPLSQALAALPYLQRGLDPIHVAQQQQQPVDPSAAVYFALDAELQLPWLRQQVAQLPEHDLWQRKARAALAVELEKLLATATARLLSETPIDPAATDSDTNPDIKPLVEPLISQWQQRNAAELARCSKLLEQIRSSSDATLPMLTVAVRELGGLSR